VHRTRAASERATAILQQSQQINSQQTRMTTPWHQTRHELKSCQKQTKAELRAGGPSGFAHSSQQSWNTTRDTKRQECNMQKRIVYRVRMMIPTAINPIHHHQQQQQRGTGLLPNLNAQSGMLLDHHQSINRKITGVLLDHHQNIETGARLRQRQRINETSTEHYWIATTASQLKCHWTIARASSTGISPHYRRIQLLEEHQWDIKHISQQLSTTRGTQTGISTYHQA
jgi:hypothetical protein